MVLWNVKLFDRVLVTVTERATAEGLVALLNNGTLYGVPGDPAAFEDARGQRMEATYGLATLEPGVDEGVLAELKPWDGHPLEPGELLPGFEESLEARPIEAEGKPAPRTTRRRREQKDGSPPDAQE